MARPRKSSVPPQVVNRETIDEVAKRLFSTKGFADTSMHDIAQELGVQRGSLYHHIESKDLLLLDMVEESVNILLSRLGRALDNAVPADEKLKLYFMVGFESIASRQQETLIWISERHLVSKMLGPSMDKGRSVDKLLMDIIEEGIATNCWAPRDKDLSYQVIRGMVAWFPYWYRSDGRLSVAEISSSMARWAIQVLKQ